MQIGNGSGDLKFKIPNPPKPTNYAEGAAKRIFTPAPERSQPRGISYAAQMRQPLYPHPIQYGRPSTFSPYPKVSPPKPYQVRSR